MLRIEKENKRLVRLEPTSLTELSLLEREHLQEFILGSPDQFFDEIGSPLFLAGSEVRPSDSVQDRIDLLAIDKEGALVVAELKRGNHKLQLLQAIAYAGMVAQWGPPDVLDLVGVGRIEALQDFLEVDTEQLNREQKILLIAEAFDYEVLIAAEWLSEQYGVRITCCKLGVAKDATTKTEYLVCRNVFPAPELATQAIPRARSRRSGSNEKWPDWDAALAEVSNQVLVKYFREQLASGCEDYLRKRILRFRLDGKRRWSITARRQLAYGWQHGRFPEDVEFWKRGLSSPDDVKPVKRDTCLRFYLETESDFLFFRESATKTLNGVKWLERVEEDEP